MKIALIGHGAMGKLIALQAAEKKHDVGLIINENDANLSAEKLAAKLRGKVDVAIDFTIATAVRRNIEACVLAKVPIVEGTTGWQVESEEIRSFVKDSNGALVYGANFSIGVNLFYRVVDLAAELFAKFEEYETFVEEQHHSRKKDAPSGTALKLKEIVAEHFTKDFSVASTRAGHIPGTHRVGFDAAADQILVEHAARNREGFASGAILAAEWLVGKTGVYEFSKVIDGILEK